MAEKIFYILKNNELRNKMSAENIKKSRVYSWKSVAEQLESIYRQLLSRMTIDL